MLAWIFSLCVHEFSHAIVAYKGGDYTVKEKGYLTFNPLLYTNPMMTFIFPVIILAIGGIPFPGGAVSIRTDLLKNKHWASAVSAAGPLSNLLLAVLLSIPLFMGYSSGEFLNNPESNEYLFWSGYNLFVWLMIFVTVLNLLPIPGLDGWGIIHPYCSREIQEKALDISRYAIFILIGLLFFTEADKYFLILVNTITESMHVNHEMVREGLNKIMIFSNR